MMAVPSLKLTYFDAGVRFIFCLSQSDATLFSSWKFQQLASAGTGSPALVQILQLCLSNIVLKGI